MCEYCRTKLDIDGKSVIPANPKPIIDVKWNDLGLETDLLGGTLFINVDIYDEDDEPYAWKSYVMPINYCPMCGRKLDGGE